MGERSGVFRAGPCLFLALLGCGVVAACSAEVETKCFDGPCNEQDDPATTAATTTSSGTTTEECPLKKDGSDACSDDPQSGDFPCDVFTVLEAKCHTCHTDPHAGNAPIDLLTCDRFHEKDCGKSRSRFRMADFYVCSGQMPQGGKKLTDAEKQTLIDWLDACAPCVAKGSGCSGTAGASACFE